MSYTKRYLEEIGYFDMPEEQQEFLAAYMDWQYENYEPAVNCIEGALEE
jgi:hypothetical protein